MRLVVAGLQYLHGCLVYMQRWLAENHLALRINQCQQTHPAPKTDVLVLDDRGMGSIDSKTHSDLLEIIDHRAARM